MNAIETINLLSDHLGRYFGEMTVKIFGPIVCSFVLTMTLSLADAGEDMLVKYSELVTQKPDIEGKNIRVWNIRQNATIRINLVEMSGELPLHKHPDADHSLMVLEGQVRAQVGEKVVIINKGDYISIPADIPHKYWSLSKTSLLVSMDAPYYDPRKTVPLE